MSERQLCERCLQVYGPEEINGIKLLKEFNGYTIDVRLKQFRKFPMDDLPEFIEFDSTKGQALLNEMHKAH